MPLNEARGFAPRRSAGYKPLNKQQKHEAHAAILGLAPPQPTMQTPQLTTNEVESMRALVAQHDASYRSETKEFDLNNPPKQPYTHQEFPRLVYHHMRRMHRVAQNAGELAAALEAGWSKEPFAAEQDASIELDEENAAEARASEAKLAAARKAKRG
jgi:hypothetical protein